MPRSFMALYSMIKYIYTYIYLYMYIYAHIELMFLNAPNEILVQVALDLGMIQAL